MKNLPSGYMFDKMTEWENRGHAENSITEQTFVLQGV